ncbi:16S rRNA (guanine(966)-N(2))-methyltransferase RsmD [Desulfallas thermosapovorans]|uniref:16S rRNA (Guanine(966)-N(2))-methyltransferase RsmD n=1 Tax=Desulfallas thermosapovorans DSM 6562 TaxID=1121431 RepID=A0A5S4ZWZ7_9FIRM|nr:16S rRNA (guanine(966)-N(2))-methyltransferase RsmD [Desulfallas thermosapovorans DSM 6562]
MRVIAGKAKKRRLKSPGKLPVRPTADRVKESLFNIIGGLLPDSYFADLYAGTGGVGIEALSRGAARVLFVEKDARVMRILQDNIAITGLGAGAEVFLGDAERALAMAMHKQKTFNIIFADPPYRQGLAAGVLNILNKCPVLHVNGIVVLEVGADEEMPDQAGMYRLWRRVKYGDTALVFYQLQSK